MMLIGYYLLFDLIPAIRAGEGAVPAILREILKLMQDYPSKFFLLCDPVERFITLGKRGCRSALRRIGRRHKYPEEEKAAGSFDERYRVSTERSACPAVW